MGDVGMDSTKTDDEEFEHIEMTTDELTEVLSTGGTITVYLSDSMAFDISVADVGLSVRLPLEERAVKELADGLPDVTRLAVPPLEQIIHGVQEIDEGEAALLQRALEARARLLGN
jgi:hypothetical protein